MIDLSTDILVPSAITGFALRVAHQRDLLPAQAREDDDALAVALQLKLRDQHVGRGAPCPYVGTKSVMGFSVTPSVEAATACLASAVMRGRRRRCASAT